MQLDLVPLWTAILALAVFMYVLLDGFDLGVGMLFPFIRGAHGRDHMLAAIAPPSVLVRPIAPPSPWP